MSMFLINDNLNPSPINNGHFLADPLPLNTSAIILPNPILPLPYSLSLLKRPEPPLFVPLILTRSFFTFFDSMISSIY